jgi:hypothetical protein
MNQITEQSPLSKPQREFSQDFIIWLGALTIVTLVLVFIVERMNLFPEGLFNIHSVNQTTILSLPWIQVGYYTIRNGLEIFSSGHLGALPALSLRLGLLISVLLVFVLGPTLLFFGWRKRAQEKVSGTPLPMWRGSTILFVVGIIITASMALPVIPDSIIQRMVAHSLRSSQAIEENKDMVIYELNAIIIKAHEYRVLPQELQGGGGSFSGFKLAEKMANTPNATYTITVTNNAVTIVATSQPYPDATITVQAVSNSLNPANMSFTGSFQR